MKILGFQVGKPWKIVGLAHWEIFAGFSLLPLGIGVGLNLVFFSILNFWSVQNIERAYERAVLDPKTDFVVWEGNQKRVIWQQENLRNWLMQEVRNFSQEHPMSAGRLIEDMFATVKSPEQEALIRNSQLRAMVTGNLSGFRCLWMDSRYIPADGIYERLVSLDEGQWQKVFDLDKDAPVKKNFIIHCIRLFQNQLQQELRLMKKFNGDIQWLIGLNSWILLVHLISRYLRVHRCEKLWLRHAWLGQAGFPGAIASIYLGHNYLTPTSPQQLKESIDNTFYYPYQFFLGVVPSLGFIGTVLGMGKALIKADMLFVAQNNHERQIAVNSITQELGYAFDTTMVALVAGILVGIAFLICHRKDCKLLLALESAWSKGPSPNIPEREKEREGKRLKQMEEEVARLEEERKRGGGEVRKRGGRWKIAVAAGLVAVAALLVWALAAPEKKAERPRVARVERERQAEKTVRGFEYLGEDTYRCGGQSYTVKEYRHEKTGMEFVLVPGGSFEMGSNDGESDEKPVHEVNISPFMISKTEVTQGLWEKVMGGNPSYFKKGAEHPVEQVSWDEAQGFCKETGLVLPTEAQWEYACRGGNRGKYCFGDDESQLKEYAWYEANREGDHHPVKQKKPNALGCTT